MFDTLGSKGKVLNVPIGQLGERTAYLYARLKELVAGGKMSSVILTDAKLSTAEGWKRDCCSAYNRYRGASGRPQWRR